jgi:hypothetical protein
VFIEGRGYLDHQSDYQLIKEDTADRVGVKTFFFYTQAAL